MLYLKLAVSVVYAIGVAVTLGWSLRGIEAGHLAQFRGKSFFWPAVVLASFIWPLAAPFFIYKGRD